MITKINCYVIDYKTGSPNTDDKIQIVSYSKHLEAITDLPIEPLLVYIQERIQVKKISNYKNTIIT